MKVALYATQSREAENIQLAKHREQKEDDWISLANEVLVQSKTVRAFGKQDAVAAEFKKEYEVFYTVHRKHRKFELGTIWKCHWYNGAIYYSLLAVRPFDDATTNETSLNESLISQSNSSTNHDGWPFGSVGLIDCAACLLDCVIGEHR